MNYEAEGTIDEVGQEQQFGSNGFRKRSLIVQIEDGKYMQECEFICTQDRCNLLDNFRKGDKVKIEFNLKGRRWEGPKGTRWFNELSVWRIDKTGESDLPQFEDGDQDIPF